MYTILTYIFEGKSRLWKFGMFSATLFLPLVIFSLSMGRFVFAFFLAFPIGLFFFIPLPFLPLKILAGWGVYIALIVKGLKEKRPQVVAIIYLIFVAAVLANLGGCAALINDSGDVGL